MLGNLYPFKNRRSLRIFFTVPFPILDKIISHFRKNLYYFMRKNFLCVEVTAPHPSADAAAFPSMEGFTLYKPLEVQHIILLINP